MKEAFFLTFAIVLQGCFLFGRQLSWNMNTNLHEMITVLVRARYGYPFATQLEYFAWLRSSWDLNCYIALKGLDLNLGTESGIDHINLYATHNVWTLPFKVAIWTNVNLYVQIATLSLAPILTASTDANRLTVINTGWHFDLHRFRLTLIGAAIHNTQTELALDSMDSFHKLNGQSDLDGARTTTHRAK